jgi:hypothetical protein
MAIRYLYTDVDMYTLDEFMEKAPEELRAPNIDAHTLMLNRLQFELQERERYTLKLLLFIK